MQLELLGLLALPVLLAERALQQAAVELAELLELAEQQVLELDEAQQLEVGHLVAGQGRGWLGELEELVVRDVGQ